MSKKEVHESKEIDVSDISIVTKDNWLVYSEFHGGIVAATYLEATEDFLQILEPVIKKLRRTKGFKENKSLVELHEIYKERKKFFKFAMNRLP